MLLVDYRDKYLFFNGLSYNLKGALTNSSIEITKDLISLIKKDFLSILFGFLDKFFQQQVDYFQSKTSIDAKQLCCFLMKNNILERLSYFWFPDILNRTLEKHIQLLFDELPLFNDLLFDSNIDCNKLKCLYKVEFPCLDGEKEKALIYLPWDDLPVSQFYKKLYFHLLSTLKDVYYKPSISFYVNFQGIKIASENDFIKQYAFDEISRSNVLRLVDRLLLSVEQKAQILTQEEIVLCFQLKLLLYFYKLADQKKKLLQGIDKLSPNNLDTKKIQNAITALFRIVLKGQKDNFEFATQEQYVQALSVDYPQFSKEQIIKVFESIMFFLPRGMSRLIIPSVGDTKKIIYFISLNHTAFLFSKCKLKKNGAFDLRNEFERHFFFFLRKIFKEYVLEGYGEHKIASILHCSISFLKKMQKSLEKTKID